MGSIHLDTERTDFRTLTVLLVDDQRIVGESIRSMLRDVSNCEFHHCQEPSKAIEIANTINPTVILLDLVMPEIDGLLLVKFFRVNKATRDTPLIVLSSKYEASVKAQAFSLGANDYLVKLPDQLELIARVKYHSRAYLNLVERNEAFRKLAITEKQMRDELGQAARYVQSLLPKKFNEPFIANWKFIPSSQLAGDMFGYHWIDADHFAIFLLDVSGHGVGSALLAVSAGNVLANLSLPDTDFKVPGQVLKRLNDVFQMDKQNEKYFTIWYGVYHVPSRVMKFSNAGHPAPMLFGPELRALETSSFAIGMVPDWDYETETVELVPGARLLIFSDGVFEIEQPSGSMWTYNNFFDYVKTTDPGDNQLPETIAEHVYQIRGSQSLNDDFSMIDIRFS